MKFLQLLQPYILPLAAIVASAFHGWLVKRPSGLDKAQHLAQLARDTAATVYAMFPTLPDKDLVQKIVELLSQAAGVPTTDQSALERAAYGALAAIKAPPGK